MTAERTEWLESIKWLFENFKVSFIADMSGIKQPNIQRYVKGERKIEVAQFTNVATLKECSDKAKSGKEQIERLLQSDLAIHEISKETGVSTHTLNNISLDFKKISYKTFIKLLEYAEAE